MVSVCLEITTTRDIARQMLRHRSFSFQEFSQRYADPVKSLHTLLREVKHVYKISKTDKTLSKTMIMRLSKVGKDNKI